MKTKKIMPESFYEFDTHMNMEKLSRAKDNGNFVVAKVLRWDEKKKCLIVRFGKKFRGIIPLSEISFGSTNIFAEINALIGKKVCVLVEEILDDYTVLLSRRKNMLNAYICISKRKNATFNCAITGVQPYAVFVDVGHGVHGIITVDNLYACYPELNTDERLTVGNTIVAKFIRLDKKKYRICLTHKDLFKNLSYSLKVGTEVNAIVLKPISKDSNAYYTYINPNTAGIIEVPKRVNISYGDKVIAKVLKSTKKSGYLRLSFVKLIN